MLEETRPSKKVPGETRIGSGKGKLSNVELELALEKLMFASTTVFACCSIRLTWARVFCMARRLGCFDVVQENMHG